MKFRSSFALLFILGLISCQNFQENDNAILQNIDLKNIDVCELPMPNSGTFSYDEAEKRKKEIYNMQLSKKYFEFDNPYFGASIHISEKDEIEIYNSWTFGLERSDGYFETIKSVKIMDYVTGLGAGNPEGVLLTSEYDLRNSKSLHLILDQIFKPGVQIWYLKKKNTSAHTM